MPHSAVVDGRVRRPRLTSAYLLGSVLAAVRRDVRPLPRPPRRPAAPSPGRRRGSSALQCRTACMGVTAGHVGSRVRVKGVQGKSLKRIDSVVFEGAPGAADDVSVAAAAGEEEVRRRARAAHRGHRPGDARLRRRRRVRPHRRPAHDRPDAGGAEVVGAAASGSTSRCRATASSTAPSARRRSPTSCATASRSTVAVELVRLSDGVAITRWAPGAVTPGVPQTIAWDGTAGGKVQQRRPLRLPRLRHLGLGRHRLLRPGHRARHARQGRPGLLPLPAQHLPDPRPALLRHRRGARSAAAAATRARTSSPSAARRWSPPAAAS